MFSPALASLLSAFPGEPNTRRYDARLTVALSREARWRVDLFMGRLRRSGALADMHALWLVAGPSVTAGLRNMLGTHASAGALYGGADFAPYRGLRGNADAPTPDTYINTGVTWGQVPGATPTRLFAAIFATEDIESSVGELVSTAGGGAGAGVVSLKARVGKGSDIHANGDTADTVAAPTGMGFLGFFRNGLNTYVANRSGVETVIAHDAQPALPGNAICLLRNGNTGSFGKGRLGLAFVGAGLGLLTSADLRADTVDACESLMIGIRAVLEEDLHPPDDVVNPPHFFTRTSINAVTPAGLEVIQKRPPPADNATNMNFGGWPATLFVTPDAQQLIVSTVATSNAGLFLWADRSNLHDNTNPNLVPGSPIIHSSGVQCRVEFTTVAKAAASMKAKVAYHVGKNAREGDGTGWLDLMEAGGLTAAQYVTYAGAQAQRETLFTGAATNGGPFKVALDLVVLPPARLCDAAANRRRILSFDYEVGDYRSEAETLDALLGPAAMIRAAGIRAGLYIAGNADRCGVSVNNAWQLLAAFDSTAVALAYSGHKYPTMRDAILAGIARFKGPLGDKPVDLMRGTITVGLGAYRKELTDPDVAAIRAFVTGTDPAYPGQRVAGVEFWTNGAILGGGSDRRVTKVIGGVLGLVVP